MKNILYTIILSFLFSYTHAGMTDHINKREETQKKEKAIIDALGLNISLEEVQKCDETDGKFDCRSNQVSIKSLPRCIKSRRTLPSMPLPSLISVCSALETTSLEANSI